MRRWNCCAIPSCAACRSSSAAAVTASRACCPTARGVLRAAAGRVVCLIDPVGDVYACPFAIHDRFRAGNVVDRRTGFDSVWKKAPLFRGVA